MEDYFPEDKSEIVQALYFTECEFRKCLGFCKYHQAYVTVKQLKQKECLAKECPHLIKTEHEFWIERDKKLKGKKEKKILQKLIEQKHEQKKIKKRKYICIEIINKEKNGLRKGALKGLKKEIVKIEAVKLDEKYNFESKFSAFIKPIDEKVEKKFEKETGITQEELSKAKVFLPVMKDFQKWIEGEDISLFCWTSEPYIQLYDETFVKARDNKMLFELYETFVDLQDVLSRFLHAKDKILLRDVLKMMRIKRNKKLNVGNASNLGKILQKMMQKTDLNFDMKKVESYEKGTMQVQEERGLYLNGMIEFINPELVEKYSNNEEKDRWKRKEPFSKFFLFSKYKIPFSLYSSFIKKMK